MRRQCYKLYAAFMHATMINPANQPVEFEVSIGEFQFDLNNVMDPICIVHVCVFVLTRSSTFLCTCVCIR